MEVYQAILAVVAGFSLAAACGFRVFVPMLVISLAVKAGYVQMTGGWEWVGQWPALATFAVATALEITAYYVPWLDNLFDTIATPAAIIAGTVTSASFIAQTGMHPMLGWSLAAVGGGGAAGVVQLGSVAVRTISTVTTGGLANPVVSTIEWVGALLTAVLAILVPVLLFGVVLAILAGIVLLVMNRRRRLHRHVTRQSPASAGVLLVPETVPVM